MRWETLAFGKTLSCPSVFNCVCSEQRGKGKNADWCVSITLTIPKVSRARRSRPRWISCPSPRIAKFGGEGKVLYPPPPVSSAFSACLVSAGAFPEQGPRFRLDALGAELPETEMLTATALGDRGSFLNAAASLGFVVCPVPHNPWLSALS